MKKVKVYTKNFCPYCEAAKRLLQDRGIEFEEIRVDTSDFDYEALKEKTGWKTVPQIFFGETLIGGFDQLSELDQKGELLKKIEASK